MANKINVKLILELLQTPMSQRQIEETRHISSKSITAVCRRAAELGVSYADLAAKSDDEVYLLFFPDKFHKETIYAPVNYEHVHVELKKTGVTLKLLWQEYKDSVMEGVPVGYSKFCDDYAKYVEQNNLTNHITHKPGVVCEVDWSGKTMRLNDDFYQYYGGNETKGIDVSIHNGIIDWNKVKESGIDFAIIRAGFGRFADQKDENFERNYDEAKAAGIPIGAYWYSYATTVEEAIEEAEVFVSLLSGKQFEYPLFFDQEEQSAFETGKENCSKMIRAFCDVLEANGYWAGLYTSRSYLETYIEDDIKTRYALWIAEWGSRLNYNGPAAIWQYSEKGYVDGISGNVDLDICYRDFPTVIKEKGFNGFGKTSVPVPADDKNDDKQDVQDNVVNATIMIGNETYKGTFVKE